MESMVSRMRPMISELQDISTAVKEGIDCVILGPETAVGPFYAESCNMMSKICYESEQNINFEEKYNSLQFKGRLTVAESIANCAVKASYEMNATLIVVFTNTGLSA